MRQQDRSQASVARELGITEKHLSRVVRGHVLPSAELTVRFARHTGSSIQLLWHTAADYALAQAVRRVDGRG